jgi:hypothetical protein
MLLDILAGSSARLLVFRILIVWRGLCAGKLRIADVAQKVGGGCGRPRSDPGAHIFVEVTVSLNAAD